MSLRPGLEALIFDVDGTLAETEEVHRRAFNQAFEEADLGWHWTVSAYTRLLAVTGGKERLLAFAEQTGQSDAVDVTALHKRKTAIYVDLIRRGDIRLRNGVEPLILKAKSAGLRLAIATTTSRANVKALLDSTLGAEARGVFEVMVCGDEVARKKPDPGIYLEVLARLDLPAEACVAIEDSHAGLMAARGAGLRTIITPSLYTAHHDFSGAAMVLSDLGELELPDAGISGGLAVPGMATGGQGPGSSPSG